MSSLVLGFSNAGHGATAATFADGKLVAAIAEERLARIKCLGGKIPGLAIDEVLRQAGATRRDFLQHAMTDVYLGPGYADAEIERELHAHNLSYRKLDQAGLVDRAARAIHEGLEVGWFQGRMEFGPRALGNRSMVGRPTDAGINKSLKDRLERTEFMPFAPSVLAESAAEVFIAIDKAAHPAEFMTVTFDVREDRIDALAIGPCWVGNPLHKVAG